MPEYVSETMSPDEIGAFLSQREHGGLARAMAGSVPGTAEFAAANRGKGRLEQAASALGSAGGGSSSAALGARVSAGPIYGELALLTGEALRSIPTAIRRQLLGSKNRRIRVAEGGMPEHIVGRYDEIVGTPGAGRSIEEIGVARDLPEGLKRRVLRHELEHAVDTTKVNRFDDPEMTAVINATPGISGGLYHKGYGPWETPFEIVPHAAETTVKERYFRNAGEEAASKALVETRRREAKTLEKAHKAGGRAKAGLRTEGVRTRSKLDLPAAAQTEAEVQKALRDYEAARIQRLVK